MQVDGQSLRQIFAAAGCKFRYEPELLAADRQYEGTKTKSGGWQRLREIRQLSQNYRRSPWPHGYFAYAASHMRAQRRRGKGVWHRGAHLAAEGLYSALNVRNLYFQWQRPRFLHGLYYGGQGRGLSQAQERPLASQARVAQPLYRQAHRLNVGLRLGERLPGNPALQGSVSIVGGPQARVELSASQPTAELSLELPASVKDSHLLQVDFSFSGTHGKSQAVAWLSAFQLS